MIFIIVLSENYCIIIYIPEYKISRINSKREFPEFYIPELTLDFHLISIVLKNVPNINIPVQELIGKFREY